MTNDEIRAIELTGESAPNLAEALDQVVPLIKGGTSDLDNLQVLCRSCNASKGAR